MRILGLISLSFEKFGDSRARHLPREKSGRSGEIGIEGIEASRRDEWYRGNDGFRGAEAPRLSLSCPFGTAVCAAAPAIFVGQAHKGAIRVPDEGKTLNPA